RLVAVGARPRAEIDDAEPAESKGQARRLARVHLDDARAVRPAVRQRLGHGGEQAAVGPPPGAEIGDAHDAAHGQRPVPAPAAAGTKSPNPPCSQTIASGMEPAASLSVPYSLRGVRT